MKENNEIQQISPELSSNLKTVLETVKWARKTMSEICQIPKERLNITS